MITTETLLCHQHQIYLYQLLTVLKIVKINELHKNVCLLSKLECILRHINKLIAVIIQLNIT